MQDGAAKRQIKSEEIKNLIQSNVELTKSLCAVAEETEEKILGQTTPRNTGSEPSPPSGCFISAIQNELGTLHSDLLHLKDILKSINSEF